MNVEKYRSRLSRMQETLSYRKLPKVEHNGFLIHYEGREMLNLTSNDYLGLSSDPHLCEMFRQEIDVKLLPHGAVSSRLLAGNHEHSTLLEEDLQGFYGRESALIFSSGYHASMGILPTLTGKRDLILADKAIHNVLKDGIQLCESEVLFYRHLDMEHLREILFDRREKFENVFIVTDSIFGLEGDIANLQELCDIKKEYDAFLYVDESHAIGVRGTNGLGCCEEQGCTNEIDFIVASFGKALASYGAFVVCDTLFREYLINMQRNLMTTALPPINIAWTRFILNQMPEFYGARMKLVSLAEQLREILNMRGFETRGNSHIVSLLCGSNENSVYLAEQFLDNGFFVQPIRYPIVAKSTPLLRFALNAAIPQEDYDCLFEFIEVNC